MLKKELTPTPCPTQYADGTTSIPMPVRRTTSISLRHQLVGRADRHPVFGGVRSSRHRLPGRAAGARASRRRPTSPNWCSTGRPTIRVARPFSWGGPRRSQRHGSHRAVGRIDRRHRRVRPARHRARIRPLHRGEFFACRQHRRRPRYRRQARHPRGLRRRLRLCLQRHGAQRSGGRRYLRVQRRNVPALSMSK